MKLLDFNPFEGFSSSKLRKPENILLFGPELLAKLGDFGWCVRISMPGKI